MAENNNTTSEYVPLMSKELEDDQFFETKSNEDETLGKSLVADEQVLEWVKNILCLFCRLESLGNVCKFFLKNLENTFYENCEKILHECEKGVQKKIR